MPASILTRILPYLLLAFIGIAGWAKDSTPLLAMVVVGTAAVAIGTSAGGRGTKTPPSPGLQ